MNTYFSPDGKLAPSSLADGLFTAVLANGLKVVIREDHRTPVAVCNVWVKVGSNREPAKLRGWSHGIEHMLFKGTKTRNEGDFANQVAEAGGSTNAGTGYETTNYHITVPAENLSVAVDILGDALFNSTFEANSLDAERQVLVHENHMYDDIPFGFGITWRWGMELTYDQSPYQHPIGGQDQNLLERDREEILAFYRSAYRHDNMTVVIVGDVVAAEAIKQIESKFGGQEIPPVLDNELAIVADPPIEQAHTEPRLRIEKGDIKKAYAKLIFSAPGENDPDIPVLSVVRRVLSDGRSCRLYRQVKEQQKLVNQFAVMTETGPREGIVIIDIETDPNKLIPALKAVTKVLRDLKQDGCTIEELDRAKTRVSRAFLLDEETVQGQASTLGYYEAMDKLAEAFNYPDLVQAVTCDEVADFCDRVFQMNNLNCVIYLPEDCDANAVGIPADVKGLTVALEDSIGKPLGNITGAAAAEVSSGKSAPAFETVELINGVEVCYRVDHSVPVLSLAMNVTGGATTETADNAGTSSLMQSVQVKGIEGFSAEELHETLEGLGASVSPGADRDYGGLYLTCLADRAEQPLKLLGQIACKPTFPEHEIEQERRLALEQLASLTDNPFQWGAVKIREMIYGNHPYGRPLTGTEKSLPGITRDDLLECHRQLWTAANMQIVVSGSFDPDILLPRLENALLELPAGTVAKQPSVGLANKPDSVLSQRLIKKQNQSVVLIAWPGPKTPDENRIPLMMLREILNGQSGRLFEALRNRRSLCYNTGAASSAGFGQGFFLGYVLTAPESEEEARTTMIDELEQMTKTLVDSEELERARAKLIGNILISTQANSSWVGRVVRDRIYGRPANNLEHLVESIRQCTALQIKDVAQLLITPGCRFETIVGPDPGADD